MPAEITENGARYADDGYQAFLIQIGDTTHFTDEELAAYFSTVHPQWVPPQRSTAPLEPGEKVRRNRNYVEYAKRCIAMIAYARDEAPRADADRAVTA